MSLIVGMLIKEFSFWVLFNEIIKNGDLYKNWYLFHDRLNLTNIEPVWQEFLHYFNYYISESKS